MNNVRSLSVIVPAYNEEGCIRETVISIRGFLKKNFENFEIIVVDDGSTDRTCKIVSGLSEKIAALRVIRNAENRGKGESVKRGMLSAVSEYILFSDADLSTPIDEIAGFMDCARNGESIIIGSRALKGSNVLKKQSFLRQNMGRAFNLLVQTFLFKGIKDTQCGFKCFKKDAAREIFKLQRTNGFCFDAEILYIAKKKGYKIKEVPVKWSNRKDSRVTLISGSLGMLLDIFRIRINDMAGRYEV
ncbi:MAG: dolichyl-phosphate beta-glucosyltransferase [Candidatus Omnitrophota bacterium]